MSPTSPAGRDAAWGMRLKSWEHTRGTLLHALRCAFPHYQVTYGRDQFDILTAITSLKLNRSPTLQVNHTIRCEFL